MVTDGLRCRLPKTGQPNLGESSWVIQQARPRRQSGRSRMFADQ